MKKLLAITALVLCSSAYSQSFHFDNVKTLDIKELSEKFDTTTFLTKTEKSKVEACLTNKDFIFTKNNYYHCIKSSMTDKQAHALMDLYPLNNERNLTTSNKIPSDSGVPLPTKKEIDLILKEN